MKILLAGGGTGGHILPTLAVAKALKAKQLGVELLYVGSRRPEDRKIVEANGLTFKAIHTGKFRRYFDLQNIADLFKFWWGLWDATRILKRYLPDVVFAKGGYVSLPVVLAAKGMNIPVMVHESDSHLGLANRIALKSAEKIAVAWPIQTYWQTEPKLGKYADKFVYTGLPIVEELLNWQAKPLFTNTLPIVLVSGGSQGAHSINVAVWEGLTKILQHCNVVHQAGREDLEEASRLQMNLAPELQERYVPFDFDRDVFLSALHSAKLVVSRSGSFVFELAALGKPALLIPLPGSANDHQRKNAEWLAKEGKAVMLAPELLNGEVLANNIERLLENEAELGELSSSIKVLGEKSRQAAGEIAEIIIQMSHETK